MKKEILEALGKLDASQLSEILEITQCVLENPELSVLIGDELDLSDEYLDSLREEVKRILES